ARGGVSPDGRAWGWKLLRPTANVSSMEIALRTYNPSISDRTLRRGRTLRGALMAALCVAAGSTACASRPVVPSPEVVAVPKPDPARFAKELGVDTAQMHPIRSGLFYQDVVVGQGNPVLRGMTVEVNYVGWLADGTQFDNSLSRGIPLPVTIGSGSVIKAW